MQCLDFWNGAGWEQLHTAVVHPTQETGAQSLGSFMISESVDRAPNSVDG